MFMLSDNRADGLRLVGLFFILLSLAMMGLVTASRAAFETPPAYSFGFAWLHCAAVIFVWQTMVLKHRLPNSLVVLLTLAVVAFPCMAGNSAVMSWFIGFFLLMIVIYGIFDTWPALSRLSLWKGTALLCGAPILAVVLFLWVNTLKYANVLEPELALFGLLHVDTLYHTAISSMFTQHGAVSTGLDGLVHTPYHALSHLWIGRLSEWLNTTPIHGYYLVIQIIAIPLVIFSLVVCTVMLTDTRDQHEMNFANILLVPLCLLFLVAIGDWNSYLVSESHTFGMLIFMLGIPLLFQQAREHFGPGATLRLIVICLAGVLMTFAKISVGAIWFGGLGYVLFRHILVQRLSSRTLMWLIPTIIVVALVFFPVLLSVLPQEHLDKFRLAPLKFAKEEGIIVAVNSAVIAIGSLLIGLELKKNGPNVPLEMLAVQMATAWVLTNLVDLPGGSSYYFLTVGTWISIVVTARWLLQSVNFENKMPYHIALVAVLALSIAANSKITRGYPRLRGMVDQLADLEKVPKPPFLFATAEMAKQIPSAVGSQLMQAIFAHFSYGEKDVLVFVPPSNKAFWNLNQDCRRKALLVPSLTGIPLINGLPPVDQGCAPIDTHGYLQYSADSVSRDMTDAELCAKALKLGYNHIGILPAPSEFRVLMCGDEGA
jgi:hypothetical protein